MIVAAVIAIVLAGVPCWLFARNLRRYRLLPKSTTGSPCVSILIPARDEEANIEAAIGSVLANRDVNLEVIVLDDHSSDNTAHIVRKIAATDPRLRLECAPPLPPGWCGKQHACFILAGMAKHPFLVFMDADVRLAPDALARMTEFLGSSRSSLASGVPRQQFGTFWERLLIPLIHFVLLGFLPLERMRRCVNPAYAAGCGQLFIARADAYRAAGGHAAIKSSLHDGIMLPRIFRRAGFATDLFDATDVATCRMYRDATSVFSGLAKNATEGLAAPARIVPVSLLLICGQVLPFVLLFWPGISASSRSFFAGAVICALLPRLLAVGRFHHPLIGALLHPFAVVNLLCIQWYALARSAMGKPAQWRGRACQAACFLLLCAAANGAGTNTISQIKNFSGSDQNGQPRQCRFPTTNLTVIVVADWKGSEQLEPWIREIRKEHGESAAIEGVADVSAVPPGLRGMVRRAFLKRLSYPVLLDWDGLVVTQFGYQKNVANVFIVDRNGAVLLHEHGPATTKKLAAVAQALEKTQ